MDTTKKIGIPPISMRGQCFNIVDQEKFDFAVNLLAQSVRHGEKLLFVSDNIITWNKNLSFLRDPIFREILLDKEINYTYKSIIWRTYIVIMFARIASSIGGDFIECGTYEGHTALQIVKNVSLTERKMFLFDTFEKSESNESSLPMLSDPLLFDRVKTLFKEYSNVHVVRGVVPEVFDYSLPDKIAFAHIDMNSAAAEKGALERILPRLQKHGAVVFDDYGWWGYSEQKVALDPVAHHFGQSIIELPTGQGLLIRS